MPTVSLCRRKKYLTRSQFPVPVLDTVPVLRPSSWDQMEYGRGLRHTDHGRDDRRQKPPVLWVLHAVPVEVEVNSQLATPAANQR